MDGFHAVGTVAQLSNDLDECVAEAIRLAGGPTEVKNVSPLDGIDDDDDFDFGDTDAE